MQSDVLKIASNLISFKSISPNQAGSLNYVDSFLKKLGFKNKFLNVDETSNLIAVKGDKGPILAFAGHVDVVPPGDLSKWNNDPFKLVINQDKIYGRGIADMKGAIASFLCAIESFLTKNNVENFTLMVLLTSDEESSALHGTTEIVKYLEHNNIKIDYCVLGEPTSINSLADTIKIGRRGSVNCFLEVIGKMGHIAYPQLCINPIHVFSKVLSDIINIKWDDGNEYFPATSLQFSNINSGTGVTNIIPGKLNATFNVRYNDLHTFESIKQTINSIIKACMQNNNIDFKVNFMNSGDPFITKSTKLIPIVVKLVKEQLNVDVNLSTSGGTSDGRFLKKICAELIELGLSNNTIHQVDEHIQKDELIKLTTLYELLINEIYKLNF